MNYRFDNYIDYPNFDDIYKNANVGLKKIRQIIYFFRDNISQPMVRHSSHPFSLIHDILSNQNQSGSSMYETWLEC